MGINPVMDIDNFGRPKSLSETESLVNDILMILFGRPGFYPSIPSLGMDVSKYLYDFDDEISIEAMKSELATQCSDFTDNIDSGDIDIAKIDSDDGQVILLFILPVINDRKVTQLSIAITIGDDGKIRYNYKETEIQEY